MPAATIRRQPPPAWAIGALCAFLWMTPGLAVWAGEGDRVLAVEVQGAKTVAKETILAKVQTKAGSPYQDAVVSEDIRRLFALGYFTDVRADTNTLPDGLALTFVVKEKPAVEAIQVEGSRFLRKAKVIELFGVNKQDLYDARKVKEGIDRIKAEYARKGFSQVDVVSAVDSHPERNTITLALLVDEGARLRIGRILIEGNRAFSDARIQKLLKTKTAWWFRSGAYDETVFQEDLERVRAFYRKNGYQDVQVTGDIVREPSGRRLYAHLAIVEGMQHRVGEVTVTGATLFPERELRRVIQLKPGAVYSTDGLQEDLRLVKQYYGDRGYIHAEVAPDPQLDEATKRVNVTYHITAHELVSINRIDIQGNLKTRDVVIRRQLRAYPGETFDGGKIRKSIDRLYNLGYFEEVTVDTQPTKDSSREDLIVQVKEAKTGSFSFGGGFSSVDRLVGLIELEQRNFDWRSWPSFTGAGEDLQLRAEIGTVRRYFDLSFTEPWIFGHPVSFGFDAFNRTRLQSRSLGFGYQEEQRGGGVRLGKELSDLVKISTGYQLFRTEISDVATEASADLHAEVGTNTISEGSLSAQIDGRNSPLDPTSGAFVFSSLDLAGGPFGADKNFYRLQGGASYYLPHAGSLVLEARVRTGLVKAYGKSDEVPIFERFFGGGSGTIRGFRERRVGPRDPLSNDPIGGEATLTATLEEVMTLIKDERGKPIIKGTVFFDVGNVWRRTGDFGESYKAGTGIGSRINTPIGPVRLDIGFPVSQMEAGEKRQPRVHFNISRSF